MSTTTLVATPDPDPEDTQLPGARHNNIRSGLDGRLISPDHPENPHPPLPEQPPPERRSPGGGSVPIERAALAREPVLDRGPGLCWVVVDWIGWHLPELVGTGAPLVAAWLISPWYAVVSGALASWWAVHETRPRPAPAPDTDTGTGTVAGVGVGRGAASGQGEPSA
jgi:hypothetical protein